MERYPLSPKEVSSIAFELYQNSMEQVFIDNDGTFSIYGIGSKLIHNNLSLREVEEYFENMLDIYDMNSAIERFVNAYCGTSIGENIRNKKMNVLDDDFNKIKEIYKEIYNY